MDVNFRATGRLAALVVAGSLLLAAGAAQAQGEEAKFPAISGSAAFVSDYRFRGISFSNRDPAVQAFIQMTTEPGFFVSLWGSSIANFNGATTEVDVTGGWSGPVGPLTGTVGVIGYLYPGGTNTDIVEFFGTLSGTAGPATLTAGINWAPEQNNLARSDRYIFGSAAVGIPNSPITLKAALGHEKGSLVIDVGNKATSKFDWMLGADVAVLGMTVGLSYVGNDLPNKSQNATARDAIVIALTASF